MKRIRYIINPKSGSGGKEDIPGIIESCTNKSLIEFDIWYTDGPGHATLLSEEAARQNYDAVVAVGGDGSVNETAKGLLGTRTSLGIIPTGSGNGMARHLKIPMSYEASVDVINQLRCEKIDTLKVNNEFSIGTVGIGFDAHIAHLFAKAPKRGYSTYVKLVLTEFYKYEPRTYMLTVDGVSFVRDCFLLTFANSSQFGNNAVIAPHADVKDGILDICMMRKFPFFVAPHLIYRMMNNLIHESRYFHGLRGKEVTVENIGLLHGHIDGEPVTFNNNLRVQIVPQSISVIIP